MARFFRKRRRRPGPSKNEKKVRRREGGGSRETTLSVRYPSVERLEVSFECRSPRAEVMANETRAMGPGDECSLVVSCSGTCGVGTFDLGSKIDELVEAGQISCEGSVKCASPRYGGIEPCGFELKFKIGVTYGKDAPAAGPAPGPAPEQEAAS